LFESHSLRQNTKVRCGHSLFGSPYIENVQHRAFRHSVTRAPGDGFCQEAFKFGEIGHPFPDFLEVMDGISVTSPQVAFPGPPSRTRGLRQAKTQVPEHAE
jgi:hypothetical protein